MYYNINTYTTQHIYIHIYKKKKKKKWQCNKINIYFLKIASSVGGSSSTRFMRAISFSQNLDGIRGGTYLSRGVLYNIFRLVFSTESIQGDRFLFG